MKRYNKKNLPEYFDYKEIDKLKAFLDTYGSIQGRGLTGLNAQMQKKLAREIKRARHLALLPFVSKY
jgi:small subunit ribosomal protein S18